MRTLLLADDSITVQRVIALIFAKEPVQVVAVGDGRQALASIAARKPDIILAGTSLPHLDGYDLATQVRNSPEWRHMPVLLLAGAFELVDEARLKSSGADGVIEKPVEPTAVIRRVKELLGLKSDDKPAASGRLVTSAGGPQDKKLPPQAPPPSVTSTRPAPSNWEQLRDQSGLEADAPSVQGSSARSADYLDTLDAAFDSLDQQLSGATPATPAASEPRGSSVSSDGRNPVFEVDVEWFDHDTQAREDARAGRREIIEDLQAPELQAPPVQAAPPIFEVGYSWFAGAEKATADRTTDREALAAEMGVHEIELPERAESPEPVAMIAEREARTVPRLEEAPTAAAPETEAPFVEAEPSETVQPEPEFTPALVSDVEAHAPVLAEVPAWSRDTPEPAMASSQPAARLARGVADDFAALLAYEQGEPHVAFAGEAPLHADAPATSVAPAITEAMLDSIADRVAERLNSSLGAQWRDVMAATVRDTVRSVVSETSERLVREEIDRIKSNKA